MPRALPLPLREQIVARHQQGEPLNQIAKTQGLSYRTVLACWRRFRLGGAEGLAIHYERCGPKQPKYPSEQVAAALALKRAHPRWGAGLIRLELAQQFPQQPLAAERTLQNWFQTAGLQPAQAVQPPVARQRGQEPHAVWQIDAKERMRLSDQMGVCRLAVTDEASGALLGLEPFPPVSLDPGSGPTGPGKHASSV